MRAVLSNSTIDEHNVEVADIAVPEPGPGQVQVRVAAAVVNPVDRVVASPGRLRSFGMTDLPEQLGLGWDLAGTVSALGDGVASYHVGQPVIGLVDKFVTPIGAQAEYVVLDLDAVAALPEDADLTEAATLALNATTAVQALRVAGIKAGTTLLVTGAAGAVGGYLVELASSKGARVIGVGRESDQLAILGFGAQAFVAAGDDLADRVRAIVPVGVEVIIDAASLVDGVAGALAHGGTFIAVTGGPNPTIPGARIEKVNVQADADDLARVVADWRNGVISVRIADRYPFEKVAAAQQRLAAGGVRGRLVLIP
jgi:NADPH:quinone reductase